MNLVINHSLDEPIYQQIYRQMVQMIAEGYLQEDEELPSVRELAREAGINPMTVQKAYALLEKNNLIKTQMRKSAKVSTKDFSWSASSKEALMQSLHEAKLSGLSEEEILAFIKK